MEKDMSEKLYNTFRIKKEVDSKQTKVDPEQY
jgi:hypothetical protein